MTAIRAPFQYYGSKGALAPRIVELIPPHISYVEAFAGSAAVLLAKPPSRHEVINDQDGRIVNFWRVLRDKEGELVRSLELTPYARQEYLACRTDDPELDPVERARRFFVTASMAFNASSSGRVGYGAGSPRKNGSKPRTFASRVSHDLPVIAARLRGVELQDTDALDILRLWGHPRTVAYLDPPYLRETRRSGGDYAVDSHSPEFHSRLLEGCRSFSGTILLSGYRSRLYDSLLDGWKRHDFPTRASVTGSNAARTECVWVKRPKEGVTP